MSGGVQLRESVMFPGPDGGRDTDLGWAGSGVRCSAGVGGDQVLVHCVAALRCSALRHSRRQTEAPPPAPPLTVSAQLVPPHHCRTHNPARQQEKPIHTTGWIESAGKHIPPASQLFYLPWSEVRGRSVIEAGQLVDLPGRLSPSSSPACQCHSFHQQ